MRFAKRGRAHAGMLPFVWSGPRREAGAAASRPSKRIGTRLRNMLSRLAQKKVLPRKTA